MSTRAKARSLLPGLRALKRRSSTVAQARWVAGEGFAGGRGKKVPLRLRRFGMARLFWGDGN
jgi:hypothetical protein